MYKKRLMVTAAVLLYMSLTACSNDAILTENPNGLMSDLSNISDTAYESSVTTESESIQLTSQKETSETENTGSQTQTAETEEATAPTATAAEKPPAEWEETAANVTLYINTDGVYSVAKPLQGSSAVKSYSLNQAVKIVAYTNTDYCKTVDGDYIHKSCLSADKTVISTAAATTVTTTVTKPVTTTTATTKPAPVVTTAAPPPVTTTDKGVDDFIGRYNQRLQEQWEKDFADQVFKLTNEFRVKNGKPELKKMNALNNVAVTRAWEILYDYRSDHTRPDGKKFSTAFEECGIYYRKCGENIAAGQRSPEEVMEAWINSAGHKANILSDDFTYLAVGMYYNPNDNYGYYWTQEFCCLFE